MSDKNFDPGMEDTCELKEAWADGKKLYYVEDIPGLLEQIACLNKQLEKANERVAEKQKVIFDRDNYIQELRQENGEYAILIANLVRRADVKTDLLQNPTFEKASKQLNKFAIDNQIKGIKDLVRVYDSRGNVVIKESDAIEKIKQLRKEKE